MLLLTGTGVPHGYPCQTQLPPSHSHKM